MADSRGEGDGLGDIYGGDWARDSYTVWLRKLAMMDDKEFEEVNTDLSKARECLHRLVRSLDERKIDPNNPPKNWPYYQIIDTKLAKTQRGGEGIIVPCIDRTKDMQRDVCIKFALPLVGTKTKKEEEKPEPPKPKKPSRKLVKPDIGIRRGVGELWAQVNVFRAVKEAKEKKQVEEEIEARKRFENEHSQRFMRMTKMQRKAYASMRTEGLQRYGHIPEIYKASDPPRQYIVMEWCWGKTLIDWVQDKEEIEILTMMSNLCLFVEKTMHDYYRIHSDLKPSNFLILNNGLPVLLDFGIAKDIRDEPITRTEVFIGTRQFVSPAHYGSAKTRSYPEDIYMLGMTYWCMWNRCEPAYTREMKNADGTPNFDAIRHAFPAESLPFGLRYIYEKATDLDPERQYVDISEMREDLERIINEYRQQCRKDCEAVNSIRAEIKKMREVLKDIGQILKGK